MSMHDHHQHMGMMSSSSVPSNNGGGMNNSNNSNNGGGGGGGSGGNVGGPGTEPNAEGLIVNPRDSDVLCGRGGAALRHPGNQTYRRLVNLNKGLYITCLKTEKLKISRSIVTAIRDQNGRFLEKDAKSNAWYDIGDKKAVEKTSQALREGQPKLRLKIAELGAAAINQYDGDGGVGGSGEFDPGNFDGSAQPNQQVFIQQQQQQSQQDLMPTQLQQPQQQLMHQNSFDRRDSQSNLSTGNNSMQMQQQRHQLMHQSSFDRHVNDSQSNLSTGTGGMQMQQQQQQRQQLMHQSSFDRHVGESQSNLSTGTGGMQSMQSMMQQQQQQSSRSTHSSSHNMSRDVHADMLHRLSLQDMQTVASATGDLNQQQQHHPMHPMSSGSGLSGQFQQQQVQNQMNQQQQQFNQQQPQMQQQMLQQQQLHDQQSQSSNRMRSGLSTRAALAQEFGITESQLSLMSELSGFGGSIVGIGSTNTLGSHMTSSRSTLTASNPHITNSSNPLMANSSNPLMANSHMSNTSNPHMINASGQHMLSSAPNSGLMSTSNNSQMANSAQSQMMPPANRQMTSSNNSTMANPNPMVQSMSSNATPNTSNMHNPNMAMHNNPRGGMAGNSQMATVGQVEPNNLSRESLSSRGVDIQSIMAADPAFRNALLGLPPDEGEQARVSNPTHVTSASLSARHGPVPTSSGEMTKDGSNVDRRHIFAKMKYSRPPSVRSPGGSQTGPPGGSQQPQYGYDEVANFHMVDSSNSLISNFSHMTTSDQKPPATTSAPPAPPNVTSAPVAGSSGAVETRSFPMGAAQAAAGDGGAHSQEDSTNDAQDVGVAKVYVETGKLVDHSSGDKYRSKEWNSDAMSTGSRNSMMSGLSRMSDMDNSIFSDLSKKIGNVSTRSIAMSEMSMIELQELDEEDDHSASEAVEGPIVTFEQQPALAFERQRQEGNRGMDFGR